MTRALLFGILLCTLAAAPETVRADSTPPHPVVCSQDRRCAEQVQGAIQQAKTNPAAALATIQESYRQYPDPRLCYNLGRLLQQLQRPDKAAEQYRFFLESGVENRPDMLIKARTYLEQMERESAALRSASQPQPADLSPPVAPVPLTRAPASLALVTPTPTEKKPLYKKWWFWTIVGGAAAVVAVGTVIGVSAREPDLTDAMQYRPFAP